MRREKRTITAQSKNKYLNTENETNASDIVHENISVFEDIPDYQKQPYKIIGIDTLLAISEKWVIKPACVVLL